MQRNKRELQESLQLHFSAEALVSVDGTLVTTEQNKNPFLNLTANTPSVPTNIWSTLSELLQLDLQLQEQPCWPTQGWVRLRNSTAQSWVQRVTLLCYSACVWEALAFLSMQARWASLIFNIIAHTFVVWFLHCSTLDWGWKTVDY